MNSYRHILAKATILLLFATLLGGCGSTPPARYYTLAALTEASPPATGNQPRLVVGIGPLSLARYLNQPTIISRSGPNTLNRAELDRWGGSLADETSRVLVDNLRRLLPPPHYLILPWLEAATNNYHLQLDLSRFEGTWQNEVVLEATWLLLGGDAILAAGKATLIEPVAGEGYAAVTAAMSRTLAELSRRLAAEIASRPIPPGPAGP